ncbi:MAG: ABC transporter transmembrane domain-containing protein, partial [Rudaea sp.]
DDMAGRIANTVMQTALAVRETVTKVIDLAVYIGVYFIGSVLLMLSADWRLIIPMLLWLAAYIGIGIYFVPRMQTISERQADARSIMTGRIVDSYSNILTVKLFAHSTGEVDFARQSMDEFIGTVHRQNRLTTRMNMSLFMMNYALLMAMVALCISLWMGSAITPGAVDMQKRIAQDLDFARDSLAIRIGLHHGETLLEDNDVFGDAVNTAARMASLAKREQIITTASTVKMLTNAGMLRTRSVGQARVSGKQKPIDIVDVMWQEDNSNVTMVQRAIRIDSGVWSRINLALRYRGQATGLDQFAQPFTLGRDAASGLVVDADWVSRYHALIEYKRGYFVVSDRSTNGTYVKFGEDQELRLHRDEVRLRGGGIISLGQSIALNSEHLVYFQCSDLDGPPQADSPG